MTKIIDWFFELFFGDETRLRKQIAQDINDEMKRLSKVEHSACEQYKIESEARIKLMLSTIQHQQDHERGFEEAKGLDTAKIDALKEIALAIREAKS